MSSKSTTPGATKEPTAPVKPARSRARPNRSEEGRLEILQAATDAFMRLGYARASIDEIADQLNATKGRIYHYYRKKSDILIDIHRHVLDLMLGEVTPLAEIESNATDAIRAMSYRHAMIIMENPALARVALPSTTDLIADEKQERFVKEIRALRAKYEGMFKTVIQAGIEAGEFRQSDAGVMTKALLGSLNWTIMWYNQRGRSPAMAREDIAETIADFAVHGVSK